MQKDIKKPLLSDALPGVDNKGLGSAEADQHRDRITRFGSLKNRARVQEEYLWSLFTPGENKEESNLAVKQALKLKHCANFLLFKNYYEIDQIKLTKFYACRQHLLCPFCAAIRASKAIQKYTERVDQVMREKPKLKPVLITFTVLNGEDLEERALHLINSFRKLINRRKDWLKKGRGFNEFCKINGAMYSYENTYTKEKGWHPHIHMFALLDDWIDQEKLSQTWNEITGDSFIVDVRRVKKDKEYGYAHGAQEVCKYALKFGDLSVEKTWEAFKVLKGTRKVGLRLTGAFGSLWGVKLPDKMTDDTPVENLAHLEMMYKYVHGAKHKGSSYYDLVAIRHVEPQDEDNMEEEECRRPTDRRVGRNHGAINARSGEERTFDARSMQPHRTAPQCKKHWQVFPKTRVRMRQRIKRWTCFKVDT